MTQSRQRKKSFAVKSTLAAMLLAIAASYALVWVHTIHEHGTIQSTDQCAVCSFAKNLATIGVWCVVVATVCVAGRIETPPVLISHRSKLHLPFSARSPPRTV